MVEERYSNLADLADDLLSSHDEGDVTFEVGPSWEQLKVHKLYLDQKLHSVEVFGDNIVFARDCRPETMKLFHKMLYSNRINIDSAKRALEFLVLAEKYSWLELYNDSQEYLTSNCKNECSILIYEHAKRNDDTILAEECFEYVVQNLDEALNGEEFLEASLDTIAKLFSDGERLKNNLMPFIKALIEYNKTWTMKTLESKDKARSRTVEIVKRIPFNMMTSTEFSRIKDLDMLLSKDESLVILKKLLRAKGVSDVQTKDQATGPNNQQQPQPVNPIRRVWVDECVDFDSSSGKGSASFTKFEYKIICNNNIIITGITLKHWSNYNKVTIDNGLTSVDIVPVEDFKSYNLKEPIKLCRMRGGKIIVSLKGNVTRWIYNSFRGCYNNTTISLLPVEGDTMPWLILGMKYRCERIEGGAFDCCCSVAGKCRSCEWLSEPIQFHSGQ